MSAETTSTAAEPIGGHSSSGTRTSPGRSTNPLFNWSALVGYDFFISYRRSDAVPYATALARLLRSADFRCFLDDNDAPAGTPLTDRLRRALLRSKKLIVVASPQLADSAWVPQELNIYAATKRDIIPINIHGGLQRALRASSGFELLRERDVLWIDELANIGPGDEPSAHVLGGLQKNFRHQRANRNLRLIGAGVAVVVAIVASIAIWQQQLARSRLEVVRSQALAAEARRQSLQEPYMAMLTAIRAFDIQTSLDAETALMEALSRAPKIKRYAPCSPGWKGVGVAFSTHGDGLLATACLGFQPTRTAVQCPPCWRCHRDQRRPAARGQSGRHPGDTLSGLSEAPITYRPC